MAKNREKVLFILKKRQDYYGGGGGDVDIRFPLTLSSGLFNSAMFVVKMLIAAGLDVKLVEVNDNNDIDREVTAFHPDIVVIEALWVLPEKLLELFKLHPRVRWIVRIHSELPFLAQEGIAMDWLFAYPFYPQTAVAFNAKEIYEVFKGLLQDAYPSWSKDTINTKVLLLPNFFPLDEKIKPFVGKADSTVFDVGCFGAIRAMKNQLTQACAAITYAEKHKLWLNFHINLAFHGGWAGEAVLRNLRALFKNTSHNLIEHAWTTREEFMNTVAAMDLVMQCSFSESFNIVTADAVSVRVPVVVSPQIDWTFNWIQAEPTSLDDIVEKMEVALGNRKGWICARNLAGLSDYCEDSRELWLKTLRSEI